ncbi:MAG TPA: S41 family peptidase [Candidatus Avacidaminococcus intestinavium]|uniref:S41 family peptidase n=1 Tax=Candidatus Avacidaminococcus intestinavium TaxID=2840684 RepID=A0A9D1MQ82_9FIRM|nr:S41 family peptidase [Candidatus Avacidaminococcus intestinavium]
MLKKRYGFGTLVVACLCSGLVVLSALLYGLKVVGGDLNELTKFFRVMGSIRMGFVGDVDDKKLYSGAIDGMVNALGDPYSVYLDEEKYNALLTSTEGHFGGIGVVLGMKDNDFVVIAPLKGTPGDEAGIKSGDKILEIDGEETKGKALEEVVAKIRGNKGTPVIIKLQTANNEEVKTVTVIRSDIKLDTVSGEMRNDKIAYIRIGMFNEDTAVDFAKTFHELEASGMQALILDLRDNPGGLLTSCVKVSELLVPQGPIVSVTEKSGRTITEYSKLAEAKYPIAVLVNQGTASAAEIVAGALQDTGAGKLFGTKTFGKGSVQTVSSISNETGLKLTIAKYYTPSGRSINGIGITPDEIVEPSDFSGENQIQQAFSYLVTELQVK